PQAQPAPAQTPQQTPAASQTPTPPPAKKTGGFLGKLLLFIIIAGLLITGGYFLGTMGHKSPTDTTPTPTTAQAQVSPTQIPASPTSTSATTKTVKAGLTTSKTFKPYSIEVPAGWTDARETTVAADIDKLTLTKDGYSLTIYQAALGGGGCLYPGDKPSEMAQSFTDAADILGKGGQYKRSWNTPGAEKTISYTVCQKSTEDSSYGSITSFGVINAVSPNPADTSTLSEIDGMIASITGQ